jgi:hypothetical protein
MKKHLYQNSLSIVFFLLFVGTLIGQFVVGLKSYNEEQIQHSKSEVSAAEYAKTGHFIEAVFENWESEFLQMASYVILTIYLRQKGSAESKKIDGKEIVDENPEYYKSDKNAPWPVRRGGIILKIYKKSLSFAFLILFFLSFVMHGVGGKIEYNEEQTEHGQSEVSLGEFMRTSEFWFQSLQNWQSEFLSVLSIVVLSIFLRQHGSPESKPVHFSDRQTGKE